MRDRKGWKALGYESFKEYGEKELGYKETRIYQLVDAAEIGLQLGFSSDSTIVESPPPEGQLRPLKSVPEDVRKQIWDEATKKAEADGVGPFCLIARCGYCAPQPAARFPRAKGH